MKFALFLGCNIPARVKQYELSARAVLDRLAVEVVDLPEFKCCGYPIRNIDFKLYLMLSARNIALAEQQGVDMLTLCKCCFGSLKKAAHVLREDAALRNEVNAFLAKEGLAVSGTMVVKHFLSVLYHDIGLPALKEKMTRTFKNLKIATHYGCHALRPSDIMQFDNPVAPVVFDELVAATGSKSIDWATRLECCGAPLLGSNDELSMDLTARKLADAKAAGANYLSVACPYCQMQFDAVQQMMTADRGGVDNLPAILYPQLLGLAMGIDRRALGIDMNKMDISGIEAYFVQE
ncbi:MAG: CoB--CoM heterodisulfide reductase iron-sulfur subunit B family protein [Desulfobacterales bacterium]|nr:CoB--CoM heterodisulfide reductase iron-sulfur subunit B family protein [Desulfobacterales bacterium]